MAKNKYIGMSLEEAEKLGHELVSKMEAMDENSHPLEIVEIQRDIADVMELVYCLQNNIPVKNVGNRFYGVSVHDISIRYNDLVEELADMGDETPASVFAERYRELADCLEMIGDLEEATEG